MSELIEIFSADWRAAAMIASAIVSVCLFIFMIASATNRARKRRERRIEGVTARTARGPAVSTTANLRRAQSTSSLDRIFTRFVPRPQNLRFRLECTGLPITLGHYVMVMLIIAVGEGYSAHAVVGLPLLIAALLGIASGVALPHMLVSALIKRRQAKFTAEFPEGIDVIVRGLRAGLPVSESIIAVGRELSGPVADTFADVSERLILGDPVEKAVQDVSGKIDTPEIKFFGISLAIQRETGGNLAETLSNLSDILRRRRQMKLKIKALSSEARASAYILGCLPFVMFTLLYLVNNDYVMKLFIDPRGVLMTVVGLVMMSIGGFVMFRMVRFEI
jgi:tight adherence protein B